MALETAPISVGFGYRAVIAEWTRANLERFDALEITVDHCIYGNAAQRDAIFDLVGKIPLTAHGIGLSIGTDMPLDLAYLDEVAAIVDRLKAPAYSEHLAFTRVPGRDLANLLPLPKTEAVAEAIIAKIRVVQSRISVPFLLENISYLFDWPDSRLSDAEFLTLICRETGAGLLLDIENLYLNAHNHCFDARAFLDALPSGLVQEIHMAGGVSVDHPRLARPVLADSHSHPVPEQALALLDYALARQRPHAIIVERDDRLDESAEILEDVAHIRALLYLRDSRARQKKSPSTGRLLDRQVELLHYLTSGAALAAENKKVSLPTLLEGIDPALLHLEARFSHEKRMEKLSGVFPRTLALLGGKQSEVLHGFAQICPPTSIGRLDTARQFRDFLASHGHTRVPGYVFDVAACELALATVRARDREVRVSWDAVDRGQKSNLIRRGECVVLLRCAYDVRPAFESHSAQLELERRDTRLAIAQTLGASDPMIFEMPTALFDLLAALDDWTDERCFGATPEAEALINDLASRGILDVRA